ncbi:WVD2 family protein [candidate division KSB1 bacterium]|nr:WVD2 family protein [candidate division KSB1 bacterium]
MNVLSRILLLLLALLPGINVCASTINGLSGPLFSATAWNLQMMDLIIQTNSRFYFKNVYSDHAVTFWNVQGGVSAYYGLFEHLEVGFSQILYQDTQKMEAGYNLPDDMVLKIKTGSYMIKNLPLEAGVMLSTRFPVAEHRNIALEPYTAERVELSLLGMLSYSQSQVAPDQSFNMHLNLGYLDHNDSDYFPDGNSGSSKEFLYALSAVLPSNQFQFAAEIVGDQFIKQPPKGYYGRYSYAYFTPTISYQPSYWISMMFGVDLRLSNGKPDEDAISAARALPVYPAWRVNLGMKFNIRSRIAHRYADGVEIDPNLNVKEKQLFEQIVDEQQQVENAEQELERIRKERERMDDMLKRLRRVLDNNPKENENKPDN